MIYATASSLEEAREISRSLLEKKLIGCANIIDRVESMYRWKGKVQQDHEVLFILKTTEEKYPLAIEEIRRMHSYETPCVLEVPIARGDLKYLQWLETQCS